MLIRAVIIDDEPKNVKLLKAMIAEYLPSLTVIGTGSDVLEGVQVVKNLKPDLVFLDIRMSEEDSGFQFFNHFPKVPDFEVVFVTAYDGFIRRAFNMTSAVGYLLKPIDPEELIQVFYKVKHFVLSKQNENTFIDENKRSSDILYCYINQGTIKLKLIDGKEKVAQKATLEEYEDVEHFYRINRQVVVNMNFIKNLLDTNEEGSKTRGAIAILFNGENLNVSLKRKQAFLKAFSRYIQ